MAADKWAELRKPFAREQIGRLPKGGVMLDFVGHAVVTSRLLAVDPEWSWEPMGVDEHGLPVLDKAGNLWIRLTILGHTRIGVGDGKSAKEAIGDAIRNAAMRFGVALDLWAKEELEHPQEAAPEVTGAPQEPARTSARDRAGQAAVRVWPNADRAERRALIEEQLGCPVNDATEDDWSRLADWLESHYNLMQGANS